MNLSANPIRRFHRPITAEFDGTVANPSHASTVDSAEPRVPTEADIEYWDVLLAAVTARLRLSVDEPRAETGAAQASATLERLRTTVLQCAEALEQLHSTQKYERSRRQALDGNDAD